MFRKEKAFFLQRVMAAIETMDRWWETTRILHTGKSSSEIPEQFYGADLTNPEGEHSQPAVAVENFSRRLLKMAWESQVLSAGASIYI